MNSPSQGGASRGFTLLVTNLMKIGGLVVALNEMLLRPTLRPGALAEAAFMMAGAQLGETVVLAALDRILGREPSVEVETKP